MYFILCPSLSQCISSDLIRKLCLHTLSSVAGTCEAFREVALSCLWEEQRAFFEPLLQTAFFLHSNWQLVTFVGGSSLENVRQIVCATNEKTPSKAPRLQWSHRQSFKFPIHEQVSSTLRTLSSAPVADHRSASVPFTSLTNPGADNISKSSTPTSPSTHPLVVQDLQFISISMDAYRST